MKSPAKLRGGETHVSVGNAASYPQRGAYSQTHLDDLDQELSSGLAESVTSKTAAVPAASPPSAVRLVVLDITRQEDRDDDLVDGALDGNNGDETQDCV